MYYILYKYIQFYINKTNLRKSHYKITCNLLSIYDDQLYSSQYTIDYIVLNGILTMFSITSLRQDVSQKLINILLKKEKHCIEERKKLVIYVQYTYNK